MTLSVVAGACADKLPTAAEAANIIDQSAGSNNADIFISVCFILIVKLTLKFQN